MSALAFIAAAQAPAQSEGPQSNLLLWVALLAAMAMLPFLLAMTSSFAKLVIVGGILRQALGTPQIPPTSVITGLALVLSALIMSRPALESWKAWGDERAAQELELGRELAPAESLALLRTAVLPRVEDFLVANTSDANTKLFQQLRAELWAGLSDDERLRDRTLELVTVRMPAFVLTELTEAFQIGFLIFVPFLILDLVVSNLLLAMNMHMLSPQTVAMPLKLLLFVMSDGWNLIFQGVVRNYVN